MERFISLEAGAREYLAILDKPSNGWGQINGPDGPSHWTLKLLYEQFGSIAVTNMFEEIRYGKKI